MTYFHFSFLDILLHLENSGGIVTSMSIIKKDNTKLLDQLYLRANPPSNRKSRSNSSVNDLQGVGDYT